MRILDIRWTLDDALWITLHGGTDLIAEWTGLHRWIDPSDRLLDADRVSAEDSDVARAALRALHEAADIRERVHARGANARWTCEERLWAAACEWAMSHDTSYTVSRDGRTVTTERTRGVGRIRVEGLRSCAQWAWHAHDHGRRVQGGHAHADGSASLPLLAGWTPEQTVDAALALARADVDGDLCPVCAGAGKDRRLVAQLTQPWLDGRGEDVVTALSADALAEVVW